MTSSRLAISARSAAAFRAALGFVVAWELADKFDCLPGLYSDDGSLPRSSVMPAETHGEGLLVHVLCIHAWRGELWWTQLLACAQLFSAACLALNIAPTCSSAVAWWLHCSFCWRNASLTYILDRYLHLLLFYSIFLPSADQREPSPASKQAAQAPPPAVSYVLALQLVVIYTDAGYFKAADPARAWSLDAPVAALDTYMRHTRVAQAARHLLGASGLRLAGAATVFVELIVPWLTLFAAPTRALRRFGIAVVCGLHVGIALTMRNTMLLSAAAITAWIPFWDGPAMASAPSSSPPKSPPPPTSPPDRTRWQRLRPWLLAIYVGLCLHHQALGRGGVGCAGRAGPDAVRTLLLHQRWNVFSSAEDYVVWEIAPARLDDGSIVDLWRGGEEIAWQVPRGFDEPRRRRGRWRAWPYTAERDEAADVAFWSMLCDEFERLDGESTRTPRSVVGYHFYMMRADAVPMGAEKENGEGEAAEYGEVRKRLMKKVDCTAARDARAALTRH